MVVHAAGESVSGSVPPGTRAVVLSCRGEERLRLLADELEGAGLRLHRIIENEGLYTGQLMAVGLELVRGVEKRRLLAGLPLLR